MTEQGGRFRTTDVLRMFPTFVWRAQLAPDAYLSINEAILRTLAESGAPLDDLRPGESWQSEHRLHEREPLRDFVRCLNEAAACVLDYLKVGNAGVAITGCWANVNAPGAAHPAHNHPNNYLSGVYYVRTHANADTINFLDPRVQAEVMRPPVTALTAENTEQVVVRVQDGMLLVFPGWLRHAVDRNGSDRVRISIGFNFMFPAYAESMAQPLWLPGRRRPA